MFKYFTTNVPWVFVAQSPRVDYWGIGSFVLSPKGKASPRGLKVGCDSNLNSLLNRSSFSIRCTYEGSWGRKRVAPVPPVHPRTEGRPSPTSGGQIEVPQRRSTNQVILGKWSSSPLVTPVLRVSESLEFRGNSFFLVLEWGWVNTVD